MKTKAAVLTGFHRPFEIMELDLDAPKQGEVLVRWLAAGMCHSDLHFSEGIVPPRFPIVGGHEGAGIVEEVGPGVTKVKAGDHVGCSFIPSCGHCRYCSTGRQNLCELGATILEGSMPDGTFRLHKDGIDYGGSCILGTFSQYSTVSQSSLVKIDETVPMDVAALVGCGVPTGWGTAVNAGQVRPGDTTVIFGIGGVGINAVQGAVHAGAQNVVVVDPVPFKRDMAMKFGATHAFETAEQAQQAIVDMTRGHLADQALITVGVAEREVVSAALAAVGKSGIVVITSMAHPDELTVQVPSNVMTLYQKTIKGSLFGMSNPQYDIVKILELYKAGQIKLDELITTRYTLEEVNQGYQDLKDGKNIRGVIIFDD